MLTTLSDDALRVVAEHVAHPSDAVRCTRTCVALRRTFRRRVRELVREVLRDRALPRSKLREVPRSAPRVAGYTLRTPPGWTSVHDVRLAVLGHRIDVLDGVPHRDLVLGAGSKIPRPALDKLDGLLAGVRGRTLNLSKGVFVPDDDGVHRATWQVVRVLTDARSGVRLRLSGTLVLPDHAFETPPSLHCDATLVWEALRLRPPP